MNRKELINVIEVGDFVTVEELIDSGCNTRLDRHFINTKEDKDDVITNIRFGNIVVVELWKKANNETFYRVWKDLDFDEIHKNIIDFGNN